MELTQARPLVHVFDGIQSFIIIHVEYYFRFVFDALFLHARATQAPRCQEIFNFLTRLEQSFEGGEGMPTNQFFLGDCHIISNIVQEFKVWFKANRISFTMRMN